MQKKLFISILLAAFLCSALYVSPISASQGSAQTAIASAKTTIRTCYDSVLQAETAGANVDSLLVTLNEAAQSLSKAELSYGANDYDAAYTYASESQSKLNGFTSQATALQQSAATATSQNFLFTLLTLIAAVAIFCVGIAAWIVLSRKERRNIHGSPTI